MAQLSNEYKRSKPCSVQGKREKQEQLLFDATELISRAMEQQGILKTDLAKRLGKSKAYVTQVLGGQSNMTLRTLSDLANALGYDVELGAVNRENAQTVQVGHWNGPTKLNVIKGAAGCLQEAVNRMAPVPVLPIPNPGRFYAFERVG